MNQWYLVSISEEASFGAYFVELLTLFTVFFIYTAVLVDRVPFITCKVATSFLTFFSAL